MPRPKTIDPANGTVFSLRFCQLMDSHQPKLTHEEMGKILGVSKSSIGFYRDGTNQPNYSILIKIAVFFHCTTDYLLGVTDYKGTDPSLRTICDYSGLSEYAVADLRRLFTDPYCEELTRQKRRSVFSSMIEAVDFPGLLDAVQKARERCDGIDMSFFDEPSVDTLPYEVLTEKEYCTQESLDEIDYQLYKVTAQWKHLIEEIIGTEDLEHELKGHLRRIRNRMNQLNSEQILQQFTKGELVGFDKAQDD